jgi:hypothetical protein
MALSNLNLTKNGQTKTNFQVQYETSLPNQANVIANANALLGLLENEFAVTTGNAWFNTPSGKFGTANRQIVNLNLPTGSGANNSGYGNPINMDSQNTNSNLNQAAGILGMIFINEWVEILMSLTEGKWNAGNSSGEALSQYAGIVRFQTGHYNYYGSWVDRWLNNHPRQNWVNTTEPTDKDQVSYGCALAFIFYLTTQLNFPINQIIAAGAPNLATVYRTLIGDTGDPYPLFSGLLEKAFPSSATATIPGPVPDDPFPLLGDGRFRAAGISAIHPRTDEGAVSLYVVGIDGKVWSNFWPAGNTVDWNGWFPIGANVFPQGSPVSAIHPRTDEGAVSLYVVGIDGKVWSNFWPAGNTANWNGWFPIGQNIFPTYVRVHS